jgi:hypothetical protein
VSCRAFVPINELIINVGIFMKQHKNHESNTL